MAVVDRIRLNDNVVIRKVIVNNEKSERGIKPNSPNSKLIEDNKRKVRFTHG